MVSEAQGIRSSYTSCFNEIFCEGKMPSSEYSRGNTFTYLPEEADEPVITIVKAVALVRGVRDHDLEPLQPTIDVDTLNELFGVQRGEFYRRATDSDTSEIELSFRYEGCKVTVEQGRVRVDPG